MPQPPAYPATVFFDGDCGLCSRFVRLLRRADRHRRLNFEPLDRCSDTVLFRTPDGRVLERSRAVLEALSYAGGVWRVAAALARAVPVRWADRAYDWVARHRSRICVR